jgi:pilus assembly protein CpaF
VQAVENSVFGYGRLQPLLDLPDVENIEIHGWNSVVVQYGDGRRVKMPPVADSDDELVEAIRFLGQNNQPSRPFDDTHPTMTLALGDRFRLHAIGFGLSHRPSVVIRQHILTDVTLADLSAGGLMPIEVAEFLDAAVLARKSMVISGDQGAGKTTLLRALINAIPENERFGTIETDYELMTHLQPGRENILALQARVGHGETSGGTAVGDFTVADLMPEALRQNLSRLVVGEVRGSEAAAMFEAMQAGTGTLSTTHSHSAASTIDRLASRVAQGGVLTVDEAYRQIAHNIALFVFVRLEDDTWKGGVRRRFVSEIRQVTRAIESGRPVTHLAYHATGTANRPAGFLPDADFEAELLPFQRDITVGTRRSA